MVRTPFDLLKYGTFVGQLIYENVLNQKFKEIAPVALFRAQT